MAHGFVCRRCGWQETAHSNWNLAEAEVEESKDIPLDGYDRALSECPGFTYKRSDLPAAISLEDVKLSGGPHEGCH